VPGTVSASVRLAASPEEVWAWATTPEGINDEFRPWMRMTIPRAFRDASIADLEAPVTLGRSWILAFGVVPFDWDDLHLAEIGDRSFSERSTMLSASWWHHDRRVEADDGGSVVRDELAFELRRPLRWVPGSSRLHRAVVARIFSHRHARLAARFGTR
jgi:ligand-binding SRPBCC domain-containing protein